MHKINHSPSLYTALFCEENIWKLIEALYTKKHLNSYIIPIDVIFILNKHDSIALFNQKQSKENKPVIWDYHVILVAKTMNKFIVYDFDSNADFPTSINQYFKQTFPSSLSLNDIYQPSVKAINAHYYFQHFYSDRHHMIDVIDESLFPQYPIIEPDKGKEKLTLEHCRKISAEILLPDQYLKNHDNSSLEEPFV